MTEFPQAKALKTFIIDGKMYERVTLAQGAKNPAAIRAFIGKGEKQELAFFVPFGPECLPSNEELSI